MAKPPVDVFEIGPANIASLGGKEIPPPTTPITLSTEMPADVPACNPTLATSKNVRRSRRGRPPKYVDENFVTFSVRVPKTAYKKLIGAILAHYLATDTRVSVQSVLLPHIITGINKFCNQLEEQQ